MLKPSNAGGSKKMDDRILDVVKFLKAEAESRMLGRFADRMPLHFSLTTIKPWRIEIWENIVVLDFLKTLLANMTRDEKRLHFSQLLDLNRHVLSKCTLNMRAKFCAEMLTIFRDFLQTAQADHPSLCIRLIKTFKDVLSEDYDLFLDFVGTTDCEYILSCVMNERFREWDIPNSTSLMCYLIEMEEKMNNDRQLSVVLLKYGFPYMFERKYYNSLCRGVSATGFEVKGQYLPKEIFNHAGLGNLRWQMALEILLALFNQWYSVNKPILATVWKAIPHPYISSAEMQHLLTPFFQDYPVLLQDVCEEYVKCNTVFSVPELTKPRSLQHLARVQVRRSLLDAYSLSDTLIDSLEIPQILKSYLKLER